MEAGVGGWGSGTGRRGHFFGTNFLRIFWVPRPPVPRLFSAFIDSLIGQIKTPLSEENAIVSVSTFGGFPLHRVISFFDIARS